MLDNINNNILNDIIYNAKRTTDAEKIKNFDS